MAVFLNATGVKIGTLDISQYVSSATLTQSADELEITAMGSSSRQYVAGLQTGKLDLEFFNDFAASSVCAALQTAIYSTVVAKLVPVAGATTTISATNPLYTVSILINNLTPISGAAGEMSKSSLSFTCNSTIVQTTTGTW